MRRSHIKTVLGGWNLSLRSFPFFPKAVRQGSCSQHGLTYEINTKSIHGINTKSIHEIYTKSIRNQDTKSIHETNTKSYEINTKSIRNLYEINTSHPASMQLNSPSGTTELLSTVNLQHSVT